MSTNATNAVSHRSGRLPKAPADAASPSGKVSNQGSSKIQSADQAEGSASTFFSVARQRHALKQLASRSFARCGHAALAQGAKAGPPWNEAVGSRRCPSWV